MLSHIRVGRFFGFNVGLHYSWFLIALLLVFSLAGTLTVEHADWGQGVIWITAVLSAALFFVSILLHELSHAVVARRAGLPVHSITLFALGGVARIEKEAVTPGVELWMGIVGPITSLLLGVFFLGVAMLFGWEVNAEPFTPIQAAAMWLGYINIILAVFNLIPGFPLDGGRVLRAIIWRFTGDAGRATRTAANVGQIVAVAFIVLGLVSFFAGQGVGGLWIAFIGWFLYDAARMSLAHSELFSSLRDIQVGDIMARDCVTLDRHADVQSFTDRYWVSAEQRCFIVKESDRVVGLVTPHEIKALARDKWPHTTIEQVMRPIEELRTVTPATPVTDALTAMSKEDINQIPVVTDGALQGVISRAHILRAIQARKEIQHL